MKHSIATVSLSGTLPEKLKAISAAGFDGVEIFENDLLYFDGTPAEVRSMCADLGLEIMLFQPFRDFEGGPRDRLGRQLERAARKFDLMHELGTRRILVCSNVSPASSRDDAVLESDLHALAELAAGHEIQVGYEALAWGAWVNSYRHVWKLVQAVNHPNLGVILDSFHTLAINDDLVGLGEIPPGKIVFIQLADAPRMRMDVLEWSRHYRNFPGQGELDVTAFITPILANGYAGPLSLEIFNDGFRAAPGVTTAADARCSLFHLEELAARQLAAEGRRAAAPLFLPPSPAEYEGFEFLEFAVDAPRSDAMSELLTRFGFQQCGAHRTKDVLLFQQGDINLILNAEPDSFADAFHTTHGTSLCAVAYRVSDAAQQHRRALDYGCLMYEGKVGPNERHIPAVRSPNGALQYFVDDEIYDADFFFKPFEGEPLLKRIDHIVLGIPAERMDTWTLHLRAIFGFVPEADLTLPDPYGLMKSRVLHSANGQIRIPLNVSENQNTVLARSVAAYKGAGLLHVAFSTDDIFAAVKHLRTNGAELLDIPENYYDDLQARFGLDDAFTDQLRAHEVLYDADGQGGEFLHVYTVLIENRFFFEIVQRKGGYDQYGAPNTPVRLVAQDLYLKRQAQRRATDAEKTEEPEPFMVPGRPGGNPWIVA